jgi:uncharacterized protein DUF6527
LPQRTQIPDSDSRLTHLQFRRFAGCPICNLHLQTFVARHGEIKNAGRQRGCRFPLGPTDWKLIFDGKTISVEPSIGNWSFTCQSHYWIRNNAVVWAPRWSKDRIAAGRAYDQQAKERYFAAVAAAGDAPLPSEKPPPAEAVQSEKGFWRKLKRKFWLGLSAIISHKLYYRIFKFCC